MTWTVDGIARILAHLGQNYSKIGSRKPEFTESELKEICDWVLHKKTGPPWRRTRVGARDARSGLTIRQQRFCVFYAGVAFGNGAKAARMAGYSARRAKQTAYDLLHPRRRY